MGGVRYLCVLCSKPINSVAQALGHNQQKPHKGRLRARGLPEDHDVEAYLSSSIERLSPPRREPEDGPKHSDGYAPRMQILRQLEAAAVIDEQRCEGLSVPADVATVVLVGKVFDLRANKPLFDVDYLIAFGFEVCGSVLLMDIDTRAVLGILVHGAVEHGEADEICRHGLKLARSGGFVERSTDKEATAMAMFGFRFAGKDFGRYAHPWEKRLKGETQVPRERLARSEELELYASILAKRLHRWIEPLFPSLLERLEGLFGESEGLGRIGTTPYSTMGISENYSSGAHEDVSDFGFSFISWFDTRVSELPSHVRAGGEFFLGEYGIYFRPRHGTVLALDSSKVWHGTRRNIGFTRVGIALLAKKKVAVGGEKRRRAVGLGSE